MRDESIATVEAGGRSRPSLEDETRAALQWLADREGKTLPQLIQEIHGQGLRR